MKPIVSVFLFFYTWQRLIPWVMGVGLAVFGLGCLYWFSIDHASTDDQANALSLIVLGALFILVVPLFVTPSALRVLLENKRFRLVPRVQVSAGFALLIQAILIAAVGSTIVWIDGGSQRRAAARVVGTSSSCHG